MKMRFYLYVTIVFISLGTVYAQDQYSLSGQVLDQEGRPVVYANALLLTAGDSAMVKGAITDDVGRYLFEEVSSGTYNVAVSMVGYGSSKTKPFIVGPGFSAELPLTVLTEGIALGEVQVTSTKLLFELKQDRMVMNVDAFPSMSGNTGLELLQKVPGLIVDRQNNSIRMNARGEVLVMINNKIKRVPGEVLMAQLQGMRAENIERIEIIHQPPAKYDASGAAGIIHIVLKNNDQQGTNGSVSLNAGYGQREKAGLSLNLNSRKGMFNWYGDYNYNRNRANKYQINHFREYDYQGKPYYYENFVTLDNYRDVQQAANLGLDVDFKGNTVIGFLLGGSISEKRFGSGADSRSFAYVNDKLAGRSNYLFSSISDMSSISANANLFQKMGTGSHLNFNLDYAKINFGNSGNLLDKEDPDHSIAYRRSTPIEFWILSLDNVNQLGNAWTMETGLKGTFNNTHNTTYTHSLNDEYWSDSELSSSEENIKEKILAAYLSLKGKLSENIDTELGIRYEHYTYQLGREKQENYDRTYKKPFPIFRLNYKIDSVNVIQLGFNRSITRPSFFHLTSFFLLLDPSLIVHSNPQLQPTFTNTFKISWQRNSAIFSLSYLDRANQIYFYNTVDKESHFQTSVPTNLDMERIIEASLSFPIAPAAWWEMNWNLNAYHHKVKDESSRPLAFENEIITYGVQLNNKFLLPNDWSFGIDGRYMSWYLVGDQRLLNYPSLNLGVRKKFSSGGSLSLAVQDVTNTAGKREWEYNQPELGIRTFGNNNFSERQVRLTWNIIFGNQKLSGKRQRKTGSEELKNRM